VLSRTSVHEPRRDRRAARIEARLRPGSASRDAPSYLIARLLKTKREPCRPVSGLVGADSPAFPFVVNSGIGAILETSPRMAKVPSDLPLRGQRRNGRDLYESRRTGFPFHPPRLRSAADTCDTHYTESSIGKEDDERNSVALHKMI